LAVWTHKRVNALQVSFRDSGMRTHNLGSLNVFEYNY
jgi:hypothetical protein